ncbi:hypothetical protein [Actinoallomurus rhizosphaericola]|uniref:hypothetical protein n=1 Tax=Actinoallomurus rhizosphaericola TaxID=2952536 RepID=UPI003872E5C9
MLGSLAEADDAVQEAWLRLCLCPLRGRRDRRPRRLADPARTAGLRPQRRGSSRPGGEAPYSG